ncbi:hypothetical protein NDU88_004975 [Pleurodeles waltl]|uniref:Uncharacterized protein n=1 Tax=Pleurodeles waltl TaxID=8319 RepID=A0AAV7LJW4_PLEWA|nr:hypothetical protein NDU88_004975 [Pleurodeles waltl]
MPVRQLGRIYIKTDRLGGSEVCPRDHCIRVVVGVREELRRGLPRIEASLSALEAAFQAEHMAQARRLIAMYLKAQELRDITHWCAAMLKWGQAETMVLTQEDAHGMRKYPIAAD